MPPRRPFVPTWSASTTTSSQQITTTVAGLFLQWYQSAERRRSQADLQRDGQVDANHQGRDFRRGRPRARSLVTGTDFLDNSSANATIAKITNASNTLRTQASTLGSNLSIVQIRQDFSKNLINVLQTGSSNLTLADTNEEAANSQALSTRQSIAVSALASGKPVAAECAQAPAVIRRSVRHRKRRAKPRRFCWRPASMVFGFCRPVDTIANQR